MIEILESLKQHSDALTVIFTAVVTLSTVVYAVLTGILVSETRKMREVQTEPKIHITLESFDFAIHIIRLNIQNIGLGPARNLTFQPSVIDGGESAEKLLTEFTESNFFKTGLRHFGPGQNVYSTYTQTTQDFEGKSASVLSFKIEYESATGKKYSDEIIIDMSEIKGRYQLGKPNLYAIASSLEKLQKDVGHIVSGFKRVKADVYSSDDRKEEKEERERWYEEQRRESENS
ncbi:hypothetical protein RSO68_01030 [Halomonas saccharevitans]|uniref:Uncharacterized protein n=1 Tax=Halomonas saccharevitans TaxID=416872 RepID=A0ABU3NC05_9GAMM|nr:hypothetical protein [Halomonas saccharevitans]MDT8878048.1 hypothetical protein [Halomonas saccharevitans]